MKTFFQNRLTLFILLLPFLKPGMVDYLPITDVVFNIGRSVVALLALFALLERKKSSPLILAVLAYCACMLFSTILNQGDYTRSIFISVTILGVCAFVEIAIYYDKKKFIEVLYRSLALICSINFILLLIFPDGILSSNITGTGDRCNFLGLDNVASPTLLLTIVVSVLYSHIFHKKHPVIFIVFASATILITWSASGVVAWAVIMIFLVLFYGRSMEKIVSFKTMSLTYVAMYSGLVLFRIQNLFQTLIEKGLGKSLTFTGRTFIWDQAFALILSSPFWGRGLVAGNAYIPYNGRMRSVHNAILDVLLSSGFVGLLSCICIFVIAGIKLEAYKKNTISCLMVCGLFSILVNFLMEIRTTSVIIYILVAMAYHVADIISLDSAFAPSMSKTAESTYIIYHKKAIKR